MHKFYYEFVLYSISKFTMFIRKTINFFLKKKEDFHMYSLSDFHCDTITRLEQKQENLYENTGHIDIKRLKTFLSPLMTFAVCLDGEGKECLQETMDYIDYFREELKVNKEHISLVRTYDEILKNKENKKISAILAIEGGEALEGNIKNIKKLCDVGVRIFTLTWNYKNEIGNGTLAEGKEGLSPFGFEVIKELERHKMIIDVSHLNEAGFWDVVNTTETAIVATHSNCRALCDNPRNLTDKQIIEIAERKGLIGMNLFPDFINEGKKASLMDIVKHIDYIVELVGIDYVCLGSDFDGVRYLPNGANSILSLHNLREILLMKYSEKETEKIICGNILRFMENFLV